MHGSLRLPGTTLFEESDFAVYTKSCDQGDNNTKFSEMSICEVIDF